jgi:hypothetical protein
LTRNQPSQSPTGLHDPGHSTTPRVELTGEFEQTGTSHGPTGGIEREDDLVLHHLYRIGRARHPDGANTTHIMTPSRLWTVGNQPEKLIGMVDDCIGGSGLEFLPRAETPSHTDRLDVARTPGLYVLSPVTDHEDLPF